MAKPKFRGRIDFDGWSFGGRNDLNGAIEAEVSRRARLAILWLFQDSVAMFDTRGNLVVLLDENTDARLRINLAETINGEIIDGDGHEGLLQLASIFDRLAKKCRREFRKNSEKPQNSERNSDGK